MDPFSISNALFSRVHLGFWVKTSGFSGAVLKGIGFRVSEFQGLGYEVSAFTGVRY